MLFVFLCQGLGLLATGSWPARPTSACRRRQCTLQAAEGSPSPDELESPARSSGFFAAYDDADLQALLDIHTTHFGDTSADPSSADADTTREELPLNGLHAAVLRALGDGDDAEAGAEL